MRTIKYCRFCKCYIPKDFDYCPACHKCLEQKTIGVMSAAVSPTDPFTNLLETRNTILESFRSHILNTYGLEIVLNIFNSPISYYDEYVQARVKLLDGTTFIIERKVSVGHKYFDSLTSALQYIEEQIVNQKGVTV